MSHTGSEGKILVLTTQIGILGKYLEEILTSQEWEIFIRRVKPVQRFYGEYNWYFYRCTPPTNSFTFGS